MAGSTSDALTWGGGGGVEASSSADPWRAKSRSEEINGFEFATPATISPSSLCGDGWGRDGSNAIKKGKGANAEDTPTKQTKKNHTSSDFASARRPDNPPLGAGVPSSSLPLLLLSGPLESPPVGLLSPDALSEALESEPPIPANALSASRPTGLSSSNPLPSSPANSPANAVSASRPAGLPSSDPLPSPLANAVSASSPDGSGSGLVSFTRSAPGGGGGGAAGVTEAGIAIGACTKGKR